MAIQRDRNGGNPHKGILSSFLIIIDIVIVAFAFYLWTNGQISKDIVAGICIAIIVLSLIILAKVDKPRK